jgi:hypothetical protein
MTTEHQSVARGDALNRRKAWKPAEIERCQFEGHQGTEGAAKAAKVEGQPTR